MINPVILFLLEEVPSYVINENGVIVEGYENLYKGHVKGSPYQGLFVTGVKNKQGLWVVASSISTPECGRSSPLTLDYTDEYPSKEEAILSELREAVDYFERNGCLKRPAFKKLYDTILKDIKTYEQHS